MTILKKVERLDDEFLGNVSGGEVTVAEVARGIGLGFLGGWSVAFLVGLTCEMVAIVYGFKSTGALVEEDWEGAKKYSELSNIWANRGADIMTLGITAVVCHR